MNVIVTGVTGLVGSHILQLLYSEKYATHYEKIVGLGRNKKKLGELQSQSMDVMEFDLTWPRDEFHALDEYFNSPSVVFHCAAAITGASDRVLEEVNIKGTEKLITYLSGKKSVKFVLISTIATYKLDDMGSFLESHPQEPKSTYGKSKLQQEQLVKNSSIPWLIIRPPFIGGPNDSNVFPEFTKRIKDKNFPLFSKKGYIGFVDARDLARAIIELSLDEDLVDTEFNVQENKYSLDELCIIIGNELGLVPPFGKTYPFRFGMFLGYLSDIKSKITRKSNLRGISSYRIRTLTTDRSMSTAKITNWGFSFEYDILQSYKDWLALTDYITTG